MRISPLAGKPLAPESRVDLPRLVSDYFLLEPDVEEPSQRVAFGTSGHRGSASRRSFNEAHILAVTQAICTYRLQGGIDGPLFLGADTHALSWPALATALEVLAANEVEVMLSQGDEYTPTPAVSHAILGWNRGRTGALADGILITPSHNPPADGGFKYNPPNGGPADKDATGWIETEANRLLGGRLQGVRRMPYERALRAGTTRRHDFRAAYVADLAQVIDFDAIRAAGVCIGVDPLGGAGVHYWDVIGEHYGLDLTVVNPLVDAAFSFMTCDWDGQVRMDPSSPYAMRSLIDLRERFDVSLACDTDHDRHGIVTRSAGLVPSNHYLAVCVDYLFAHRPRWPVGARVGKTLVSSQMIDRVAARAGRGVYEVPVGFKWFVDGLLDGTLAFVGEESAGASFLRQDGRVWTTDKDGMTAALLAAELTGRLGRDPGEVYAGLAEALGSPCYERRDAPATPEQKALLGRLTAGQVEQKTLAGESIEDVMTHAPGNGAAIGGLKVCTHNGWFAARPSGTENIYKIYAESFLGEAHLARILEEAQALVTHTLDGGSSAPGVAA